LSAIKLCRGKNLHRTGKEENGLSPEQSVQKKNWQPEGGGAAHARSMANWGKRGGFSQEPHSVATNSQGGRGKTGGIKGDLKKKAKCISGNREGE